MIFLLFIVLVADHISHFKGHFGLLNCQGTKSSSTDTFDLGELSVALCFLPFAVEMVLLCRGIEVLPQTSIKVTPAEKDGPRSERQKASGNRRAYELVTFILIIHCYGYVSQMEQFVRKINGVESVKSDINSNKLEVQGRVNPRKIQKMVKRKTKTKVKLIYPAKIEDYGDENEAPEGKLKEEKTRPDDIANKKSEENEMVLKIIFCCESCNLKLEKILKVKGLVTVSKDMEKDLITVKGTVSAAELRSYIKAVLKKDVEVVVPAKKDIVSTKEKGIETGAAIHKKVNDAGAMGTKGKEVVMRERESKPTEEKSKGKEKEAGAAEIRHKDSEPKGSAVMGSKSENKGSSVNNQNKDKDRMHHHPPYNHRPVDYVYDYNSHDRFVHSRSVYYHPNYNMFSDENPHSYCTIL